MRTASGFVYPVAIQIAVDTLNIHRAPHLDEIATAVLLFIFGESFFPGVRKAFQCRKIVFDEHPDWTREDFIRNRTLPIGTGFGTWFNEHLKVGGRMHGVCAFSMAARYLRVDRLPALQRFMAEVLACDTKSECRATMLAELIKVDNRRKSGITMEIFLWAAPAIMAVINREMQILDNAHMVPVPGERTLLDHYQSWMTEYEREVVEDGGMVDPRVKESMLSQMHMSTRDRHSTVTELAHIVESMARTGIKDEEIADWLQYAFVAIYIGQREFFAEVDRQMPIEPIRVPAILDDCETYIMVSVVESDSLVAHKAARHCRNIRQNGVPEKDRIYGVTAVGNSSGNICVFTDREIRKCAVRLNNMPRFGLQDVTVCMVRALELKKQGETNPPRFAELNMQGDGPDGVWHYHKEAESIMNGTPTHPRPPTKISLDEMTEILCSGYLPARWENWMDDVLR